MLTKKVKEAQRLCEKEFSEATDPQEIDGAYEKYLNVIGEEYWPNLMLRMWQMAYGVRNFDSKREARRDSLNSINH